MTTALITGASSGIGEQFAYALARQRYQLVLVARREARLQAVAETSKGLGAPNVDVIVADLSRSTAAVELEARLSARLLEIDWLINNAGFGTTGEFHRLPLDREIEEIQLNVIALLALTRLFLPGMIHRRRGAIINVASTAAFQPIPFMSTYAATKAFVLNFTEALTYELAGSGVHVLALCPGPVHTEFHAVAKNHSPLVPRAAYLTADKVVAQALAAVARGRNVRINGLLNRLGATAARVSPRRLVTAVAGRIYRPCVPRD